MNTFSVSRLTLALAFGVTLTACSSTPSDQHPSNQAMPGTSSRLILSAREAQNFDAQYYFASLTPSAAAWNPPPVTPPAQPDFAVGPAGTQGIAYTMIQAVANAVIIKCINKCQCIIMMSGEYQGTAYVPAAPSGVILYGAGEKPIDVKVGLSLDGGMSLTDWCHDINPCGKYIPGKPARYMYGSCQGKRSDSIGVLCSAVFWSQSNDLWLQNLTTENTLGDSIDAGNYPAVTLRTDGDQVQINSVNIFGRQNTFLVTSNGVQSRLETDCQPHTLVVNSYIERDADIASGHGAVVFDSTEFRVVGSRTQQEAYVFASATLSDVCCGFLTINSRFNAFGDGTAQLGRSLDVDANTNGRVAIRGSTINGSLNTAKPWVDAAISDRLFAGSTDSVDDNDEIQLSLNDTSYNRMWEYNNRGVGSKMVAEAKK